MGRVLTALDRLKLGGNTIVLFMTDNGPQQPRYNAGMRRLKGTVHEGGIRVPLFVRWPAGVRGGRTIDRIAAHIDVTPTLLEASGIAKPARVRFDGLSLLPLLQERSVTWPDRALFFQWHRGDLPEAGRAFAVRTQRYKLVQPLGNGEKPHPPDAPLLLFDMSADPLEERNVAAEQPAIVESLAGQYQAWFRDVTSARNYGDEGIARIFIGAPQEEPVRLTRQDWRGPRAGWTPDSLGHWQVDVRRGGAYDIVLRFARLARAATIDVSVAGLPLRKDAAAGTTAVSFDNVRLTPGHTTLAARVIQNGRDSGVIDVVVRKTPAGARQ